MLSEGLFANGLKIGKLGYVGFFKPSVSADHLIHLLVSFVQYFWVLQDFS